MDGAAHQRLDAVARDRLLDVGRQRLADRLVCTCASSTQSARACVDTAGVYNYRCSRPIRLLQYRVLPDAGALSLPDADSAWRVCRSWAGWLAAVGFWARRKMAVG